MILLHEVLFVAAKWSKMTQSLNEQMPLSPHVRPIARRGRLTHSFRLPFDEKAAESSWWTPCCTRTVRRVSNASAEGALRDQPAPAAEPCRPSCSAPNINMATADGIKRSDVKHSKQYIDKHVSAETA